MKLKILTIILSSISLSFSQVSWEPTPEIVEASSSWHESLEGINLLSEHQLFRKMIFIWPQKMSSFQSLKGSEIIQDFSYRQMIHRFFKGGLEDDLKGIQPSKYYFRNEEDSWPDKSLLYREVSKEGVIYSVLNNQNAMLLSIDFHDGNESGVEKSFLSNILLEGFNVGSDFVESVGLADEGLLTPGWFYTELEEDIIHLRDWKEAMSIFVTSKGVAFLLFNLTAKRAGVLAICRDSDWLNMCICDENGALIDERFEFYKPDGAHTHFIRKKTEE